MWNANCPLCDSWDNIYSTELENFEELGDEGEIWWVALIHFWLAMKTYIRFLRFGEESVEKMVDWAMENVPPSGQPTVLEVGSGNGTLLFALQESGYLASRMCGFDYSSDAVNLAKAIGSTRGDGAEEISFTVCDFLSKELDVPRSILGSAGKAWERWDLVLDKGTLDAIALGEKDESGRSPAAGYPLRLARLLRPGGYFLVTCGYIFVSVLIPRTLKLDKPAILQKKN